MIKIYLKNILFLNNINLLDFVLIDFKIWLVIKLMIS